jgi:hypothetical protein
MRNHLDSNNTAYPTLVFFGHHRSASTWILNILTTLGQELGLRVERYHEISKNPNRKLDIVIDVNARWEHRERFDDYLGLHVIRDPRDIVVSAYFSHKYSHPSARWLEEQRQRLQQVSQNEGIRLSIEFREKQFQEMADWHYGGDDRIYETKYEIITRQTQHEFQQVMDFWGLFPHPIGERQVEQILNRHRFEKKTAGRERGQEDVHHHYRKGIAGDWVNYFNQENKDFFKEKWGSLLIKLGYEKDLDW